MCTMSAQRRWVEIVQMLCECFVFAGYDVRSYWAPSCEDVGAMWPEVASERML